MTESQKEMLDTIERQPITNLAQLRIRYPRPHVLRNNITGLCELAKKKEKGEAIKGVLRAYVRSINLRRDMRGRLLAMLDSGAGVDRVRSFCGWPHLSNGKATWLPVNCERFAIPDAKDEFWPEVKEERMIRFDTDGQRITDTSDGDVAGFLEFCVRSQNFRSSTTSLKKTIDIIIFHSGAITTTLHAEILNTADTIISKVLSDKLK